MFESTEKFVLDKNNLWGIDNVTYVYTFNPETGELTETVVSLSSQATVETVKP